MCTLTSFSTDVKLIFYNVNILVLDCNSCVILYALWLPYSAIEQPAKHAKAAYEEMQLHRKIHITSSNDLKTTIAVEYVKAFAFPLSTSMSHSW
jgi:hypothetical protein